jgi:hypothetical protein
VLADVDREYLERNGLPYEVQLEGQTVHLVLKDYTLPAGYEPQVVDLLLRLPLGFPDVPPDMYWLQPFVSYIGGAVPPATEQREVHWGRTWQRWSRHLANAWRPGIDCLQTYLRLIRTDLETAAEARAA